MTARLDFTYYSIEFFGCSVRNNMCVPGAPLVFSVDCCDLCYSKYAAQVVQNYKPVRVGRCCDLTGRPMRGDYEFYRAKLAKVTVRTSTQSFKCANCQQVESNCRCATKRLARLAQLTTDPEVLELVLSPEAYHSLVAQAETIKRVAGQWSAGNE